MPSVADVDAASPDSPDLDGRGSARDAVLLLSMGAAGMAFAHAVSALSPFVVGDLGLTALQLGVVTGTVYFTAAATSASGSRVIVRLGLERAVLASFLLAAVALVGASAASGFVTLVVGAVVGGVATAWSNPVTSAWVALHVRARAGLFLGLKQAGAQLFSFYCGIVLPTLAVLLGWRVAFLLGTAPILAGVALLLARPSRSVARTSVARPSTSPAPRAGRLAMYTFLMGAGQGPVQTFLPLYAFEELGYPAVRAGMLAGMLAVSAVAGRVLWGHFGTRLPPRTLLRIISLSAVTAVAAIILSGELGAWLLWVGAALFGSTATAWAVAALVVVDRSLPNGDVAHVAGRVMRAAYTGVLLSNVCFGYVAGRWDGYTAAWVIVLGIFALSVVSGSSRHLLRNFAR